MPCLIIQPTIQYFSQVYRANNNTENLGNISECQLAYESELITAGGPYAVK